MDRSRLTDPEYNIELGMRYLRLTYNRLKIVNPELEDKELWVMTAQAYHGGIGNVIKRSRGQYAPGLGEINKKYVKDVTEGIFPDTTNAMADSLQMTPG